MGAHIGATFHFQFNEAEKMLLAHATRVMDMGINLSQVVKIAVNQSEDIAISPKVKQTDVAHSTQRPG